MTRLSPSTTQNGVEILSGRIHGSLLPEVTWNLIFHSLQDEGDDGPDIIFTCYCCSCNALAKGIDLSNE
jgi:hypothetical protein